ncbi:hypothetical protein ACVILL_007573 [Bradyrhizobium sp. USDA 3364]
MPVTPNDPSGTFVDRLWGKPEQKTGRRASGPASSRPNDAVRPVRLPDATRSAAIAGRSARHYAKYIATALEDLARAAVVSLVPRSDGKVVPMGKRA